MRLPIISALAVPAVVYASRDGLHHVPRQGSPTPTASTPTAVDAALPPTVPPSVPSETLTYTLDSVNPNAIPLSLITSGIMSQSDPPLSTIYPPGSQPSLIPGAPSLPNCMYLAF